MVKPLAILVVEDDPLAQKTIAAQLAGHQVDFASDAKTARKKLEGGKTDLCFIDLELGSGTASDGLELIPIAVAKGIYSVVMSGHDCDNVVEKAYALGCHDFYAKGNEEANVGQIIARFLERRDRPALDAVFSERFATQDPATRASISEALKYASSDLPVLILGPSGTGKTRLAQIIHDHSRRAGAFVAINCAAYTDDLLEAELFGYRKGAFTGAGDGRKGKLLLADRGTLFLDEIGSMSLKMQTKLLKAVEEKVFYPLGSDKAETSSFRIVSATLEDMQALVKSGKLRFDFFQRIHGLTIRLKPLGERKDDVFPLLNALTKSGKRLSFTEKAKGRLLAHDWPGNVRELKKLVELLVAGHEGRVTEDALAPLLDGGKLDASAARPARPTAGAALEKLVHDVNSKCASLRDAAALLRSSSDAESAELLALMLQQAESLVRALADHRKR